MQQNTDKTNWASLVKYLLWKYGLMNGWLSQRVEKSSSVLQYFKPRVRDILYKSGTQV